MVNFCAIVGCSNRIGRNKDKSFYRLPKIITHQGNDAKLYSEERRTVWLARISRADITKEKLKNIRVCSDHFISGEFSFENISKYFFSHVAYNCRRRVPNKVYKIYLLLRKTVIAI